MTRIVLVRHGDVEGIKPPRFRGRQDLPLTERGRRQAAVTGRRIKASWRPSAIYTSPLSRTVDTGMAIAEPFGLGVKQDTRLNDVDYGQWLGLTHEDAKARWPMEWDAWQRRPHLTRIPGGETLLEVAARLIDFIAEAAGRHRDDAIVVVAHESVNRVLLLQALNASLGRYWNISQGPCAINELEVRDGEFVVHSLNDRAHLLELQDAPSMTA